MCIPPISTLRSGLRAYWVNWRGARRLDDLAAHPAREADAHAVDVGAGVVQQPQRLGVAAELDADLLEDRVGVVLDERQALLAEDLERRERAGQERDVLGVGRQPERLAGGSAAAPPPLRVVHQRVLPACRSPPCAGVVARCGRRRPAPPVAGASRRQRSTTRARLRERGRLVRERHRLDEVLLEARLDRGLDLLDPPDDAFDLGPRGARQQRDERAGPGRVAGRADVGRGRSRGQPEDHRVERVDLAAERAGQADLVDAPRSELVHQQPDAGVQRGLGELDRPDVVLGDRDARAGRRSRRPRGGRS